MSDLSEVYALAVANARQRLDVALTRQQELADTVGKLIDRINTIEQRQRAINQARAEGESTTGDAQEFALLPLSQ